VSDAKLGGFRPFALMCSDAPVTPHARRGKRTKTTRQRSPAKSNKQWKYDRGSTDLSLLPTFLLFLLTVAFGVLPTCQILYCL
jgi:hypothetical protein